MTVKRNLSLAFATLPTGTDAMVTRSRDPS